MMCYPQTIAAGLCAAQLQRIKFLRQRQAHAHRALASNASVRHRAHRAPKWEFMEIMG